MEVETGERAAEFIARAGAWVARDPVQHNVVATVSAGAALAGTVLQWAVACNGSGETVGAAICTPPRAVLLTAMPAPAAEAIAQRLSGSDFATAGVTGPPDEAEAFAAAWSAATGRAAGERKAFGLYEAHAVVAPTGVPGSLRTADEADLGLLLGWLEGFLSDVGQAGREPDPAAMLRTRMDGDRLRLWVVDSRPVAMASTSPPVDGVSRVSLVYTRPADRRRGYAAAVTAAVTSAELAAGARACMLNTERSNPTSNAVYRRIGYVDLGDQVEIAFA